MNTGVDLAACLLRFALKRSPSVSPIASSFVRPTPTDLHNFQYVSIRLNQIKFDCYFLI